LTVSVSCQLFVQQASGGKGASLQNYNNELVKCIDDLREKREEVNRQILSSEEEKAKIQKDLSILTERLQKINENLVRKTQARNEYDKTIQETEAAYMKVPTFVAIRSVRCSSCRRPGSQRPLFSLSCRFWRVHRPCCTCSSARASTCRKRSNLLSKVVVRAFDEFHVPAKLPIVSFSLHFVSSISNCVFMHCILRVYLSQSKPPVSTPSGSVTPLNYTQSCELKLVRPHAGKPEASFNPRDSLGREFGELRMPRCRPGLSLLRMKRLHDLRRHHLRY